MIAIPYFNIFFFFLFSFVANNKKNKSEFDISLKYFCIVYLLIFIGLRGFVSTDWFSYYPFYEELQVWRDVDFNYLGSFGWEIGTPFLMFIFKKLGVDYFGYCFISAFIDLLIIFHFFNKFSRNFYLSLLFFILYSGLVIEFNLLRNSKAIDLFLLSLEYIDKKKWKYILLNIIGYFFHISALFFFIFFFIYHLNILKYKKLIFAFWIIGLIIYILKIQYINVFLNSIVEFLPGRLRWIVKRYTIFSKNLIAYGFGMGFIERFVSFILIFIFHDKLIKQNAENKIFIIMMYIYFNLFLYFAEIFDIATRLTTLTIFGYWIIFPNLYYLLSNKQKKVFVIIFVLYSILKIYAIYATDLSLQYENILFGAQSYNERLINNLKYKLK